ncbi:MAG: Sensor histidine kinase RcsC [Syntrophus sp. SKADARSKE-3]|nr:Sensor histidine kinase RcsC [Syntrophus sp. SKADARSKE-3]
MTGSSETYQKLLEENAYYKKIFLELEESEKRFKAVADYGVDWENWVGPDGKLLWINQAVYPFTGYTVEECMAMDNFPQLLIDEQDWKWLQSYFKQAVEGTTGRNLEFRISCKNGDKKWAEVFWHPIFDENGASLGHRSSIRDITERKKMEESLRLSNEIMSNMSEGIVLTSAGDRAIIYANPKFEQMFGYEPDELRGKDISVVNAPLDKSPEAIADEIQSAVQQNGVWNGEVRNRKKDGTPFWCYANVSTFKHSVHGDVWVSVHTDITERKRVEEELLRVRKLESVGTLAGGIAHDFNNFLAIFQGYLELIKMNITEESNAYHRVIAAEKSVHQATELTQRLITFAKGGEPIRKINDIGEILKDTILKSVGLAFIKKTFHIDPGLWLLEIDEGQIRQVIRNLAMNAVEAMPEGGTLTIRAENRQVKMEDRLPISEGDYIWISIEDTGKGICAHELPFIFDPYYSTKQRGTEKGMGLGLSVCHSVISKHGGCITVESVENQGCNFQIYMPAVMSKTLQSSSDARETVRERILVMDDDRMIRDMLSDLLTSLGFIVDTAEEGFAAIDLYIKAKESRKPYKLILLDLIIPGGIGGKQTMERLISIDPEVRVAIISGSNDDPIMKNYRQYGFCGVLTKPFSFTALQNILKDIN